MISDILKYRTAKGPKKWLLWLVITGTALLALFIQYKRLKARRRTIEKLYKEVGIAEQQSIQLQYEAIQERNVQRVNDLMAQAKALKRSIADKRAVITDNNKAYAEELTQIEVLKSWKDLDERNKKLR
jgi:Mg2+ and Co2+ transporter CorA